MTPTRDMTHDPSSKKPSWTQALSYLGESGLSVKGLATAMTGDTTSEAQREAYEALSYLVEAGFVEAFELGGVIWYRQVEAVLWGRRAPVVDAGYAEEDPGDGRPDRLYGN